MEPQEMVVCLMANRGSEAILCLIWGQEAIGDECTRVQKLLTRFWKHTATL